MTQKQPKYQHSLLGKNTYYKVRVDGEWYPLPGIDACCDCGLVHRNEYRYMGYDKIKDSVIIEFRQHRDTKRTAALRRGRQEAIKTRLESSVNDQNSNA
jgi:hypothetical protein